MKNLFLVVLKDFRSKPVMFLNCKLLLVILLLLTVCSSNVFGSMPYHVMDVKIPENLWKIFIEENVVPHPKIKNCFVHFWSKNLKGFIENIHILKIFNGVNFRYKTPLYMEKVLPLNLKSTSCRSTKRTI